MRRLMINFLLVAAAVVVGATVSIGAQATLPDCDPDNGGITLPDGFCAMVVADNLGAARQASRHRDLKWEITRVAEARAARNSLISKADGF